jgi:dTDP-4-dehydrorhamnose 3,5-epimerase
MSTSADSSRDLSARTNLPRRVSSIASPNRASRSIRFAALCADSPTYLRAISCELSARNWRALYIPSYFAHGFQALADGTEVLYMIDRPFVPGTARGLRWNDPAIQVEWPEPITMIAQKDLQFSDWVR